MTTKLFNGSSLPWPSITNQSIHQTLSEISLRIHSTYNYYFLSQALYAQTTLAQHAETIAAAPLSSSFFVLLTRVKEFENPTHTKSTLVF